MAVRFLSASGSPYLRYATTPGALGLLSAGPLTIVGWIESFGGVADGCAGIAADDGAVDSWNARIGAVTTTKADAEYIVNSAFDSAQSSLAMSTDTWYFVEWQFVSGSIRRVRTSNADEGENLTVLGSLTPFTSLTVTIAAAGEQANRWNGCLAEFAFMNRDLTAAERVDLAAGYKPTSVFGLSNIPFYVPLVNSATSTQAYIFGTLVAMEAVVGAALDCGDAPPLLAGEAPSAAAVAAGFRRGPRPLWETPLDRSGGPKKNELWQHRGKFFPPEGYGKPPKEKFTPSKPAPEPKKPWISPPPNAQLEAEAAAMSLADFQKLMVSDPEYADSLLPYIIESRRGV